jgi:hypothetical protein
MKEEFFKANWKTAIDKITTTPFLMGSNGKWKADIDWLLKPGSVVKIMEGKYDHSNGTGTGKSKFAGSDFGQPKLDIP